ncbi:DUF3100 domain-containing protein [Eremococcus coleocola]|uniref:DUF3100 domain-containing protein n=1 Tax=Eremococcus coleocola ACS-139-V-Col8 TaxID=908337 RepID=E4KLR1_9LACT|nr:DUF3100 domain-containing protein [Eremococcus coleocola]EFR32015.1 hypothetical protein HMPREF9257_0893 [Eremococcus coleocola ACS-139-V-Col8]
MKNKFYQLLLLIIFALIIVFAAEIIGFQQISLGSINVSVLPLVFSVLFAMVFAIPVWRKGLLKVIYSDNNVEFAAKNLLYIMLPLMAYYGASVAPKIGEILSVGWVFLFQELGNLGTVLIGLPVAILLGLRREAIGATLGLGREGELAYITEKYTLESAEGRGVLSVYLIGTLFGSIFFSIFAPIILNFGFDVRALGMASGMGSASMMTAASSAVAALKPESAETILAYASASQLLTSFLGTYTMVFLAIPLQRFMYNLLTKGDNYDHGK